MKKLLILLFIVSFFSGYSQEKTLTYEDAVLAYSKGLYPKTLKNLHWLSDKSTYVYVKDSELVFNDPSSKKTSQNLSLSTLQKVYPNLNTFPTIMEISSSGLTFKNHNSIEVYNYTTNNKTQSIAFDENAENTDYSNKANAVAYTLDNNLFIATTSNSKIAVTSFDDKNIVSGQAIARNEFGIKKGTFFSPNGSYLAFYQKDESNVSNYPLVDITTYPATLKNIKYPMAGQGSEKAKIGIFNLKNSTTTYLNIDTSDEHYLTNLSWTPDEKYVLVAEINRAQNHYDFNMYSVATGEKVKTLFSESNERYTEPQFDAVFLPNSNTNFLWLSQKDGFMNIYEYSTEGKLIKQLTNFKWVVNGILGFDKNGKDVFISGTGNDPREMHTYKVSIKTGKLTNLTSESGTHRSIVSSDGSYILDRYSNISTPNVTTTIKTSNGKETTIFTAENPLKDYKLGTTEFVTLKNNEGNTLYGKITKPANFDPSKKYPVLVYVYGGPHVQLVTNSWLAGNSLWLNAFATLDNYIVFTLDNRGSANRGFEFESIIHRHVGDAAIEDQMVGVNYLKSLSYVDSKRMAINGWSFGGFMTTSLMLREPGIFTTAVAGGPVIDWKYYEVMYGERYMDTPQENPEGYEKARVQNYIQNLKGKLLLIIGSVDPVVVPQNTMTLLKAAVTKNVQLDFFTYPMHEHNVLGVDRVHLVTKMMNYIVENNH